MSNLKRAKRLRVVFVLRFLKYRNKNVKENVICSVITQFLVYAISHGSALVDMQNVVAHRALHYQHLT